MTQLFDSDTKWKTVNPFGAHKMQNNYIYMAEDTFRTLQAIAQDKNIPYSSGMYSELAKTMEQFYKGVAAELSKYEPDLLDKLPEIRWLKYHDIVPFAEVINQVLPLSNVPDGTNAILENFARIQRLYSKSAYNHYVPREQFERDFTRFSRYRERTLSMLDKQIERYQAEHVELANLLAEETHMNPGNCR